MGPSCYLRTECGYHEGNPSTEPETSPVCKVFSQRHTASSTSRRLCVKYVVALFIPGRVKLQSASACLPSQCARDRRSSCTRCESFRGACPRTEVWPISVAYPPQPHQKTSKHRDGGHPWCGSVSFGELHLRPCVERWSNRSAVLSGLHAGCHRWYGQSLPYRACTNAAHTFVIPLSEFSYIDATDGRIGTTATQGARLWVTLNRNLAWHTSQPGPLFWTGPATASLVLP